MNEVEKRLKELEGLFLNGPLRRLSNGEAQAFSIETLLDILLVLSDECSNSSLRREKTVTDFLHLGKRTILIN